MASITTGDATGLRAMQPADAPILSRLWRAGLSQTTTSMSPCNPLRYLMWLLLKKIELGAISPWGDVGPGGRYLAKRWGGAEYPSEDLSSCKLMLVAEDTANPGGPVIGCCGVKRGINETKDVADGADTDVFSVWRLSVSEKARGRGLGGTLMQHVEEWARQRGGKKMLLYTGNPVASRFYQKLGYTKTSAFAHEKSLVEKSDSLA